MAARKSTGHRALGDFEEFGCNQPADRGDEQRDCHDVGEETGEDQQHSSRKYQHGVHHAESGDFAVIEIVSETFDGRRTLAFREQSSDHPDDGEDQQRCEHSSNVGKANQKDEFCDAPNDDDSQNLEHRTTL